MMEFDEDGGVCALDLAETGRWEIHVPWVIAIEALGVGPDRNEFDNAELRQWLDEHFLLFMDMVSARVTPGSRPSGPDDPRVLAIRL